VFTPAFFVENNTISTKDFLLSIQHYYLAQKRFQETQDHRFKIGANNSSSK
jgi:hypothetical protein